MLNTILKCVFSAGLDDLYFVSSDPAAYSDIFFRENRMYVLSCPTTFNGDFKVTYRAPTIDAPGFVKFSNKYDDFLILTRDGNKKKVTAKFKRGNKEVSFHSLNEIQTIFKSLISIEDSRDNEFVIDNDGTLLYYNGTQKNIKLPSDVIKVGAFCFQDSHINSIYGKNVTEILESAFQNCRHLHSASFPKVTDIYPRAFYDSGLFSFYLNDNNVCIHDEAFGESELTSLYNHETASFIAKSAFWGTPFDKSYLLLSETEDSKEEIIDYISEDQTKYLEEGWEYEPEYALLDPTIENLCQCLPYSTIHTVSGSTLVKRECYFSENDLFLFADAFEGNSVLSLEYKVTVREDKKLSISQVIKKET